MRTRTGYLKTPDPPPWKPQPQLSLHWHKINSTSRVWDSFKLDSLCLG